MLPSQVSLAHVSAWYQAADQHMRAEWRKRCIRIAHKPAYPLADEDEFTQRHAFTASANWIVPGYVMLGRYPFVEPSRLQEREEGESTLERILGAGVTTFVALQEEVPSQEEMPARGVDGFMPYKPTADLIAAGALCFCDGVVLSCALGCGVNALCLAAAKAWPCRCFVVICHASALDDEPSDC